ncbi:glycosidase [Arcticibacter pallidicorallinus]|uniref:Glycosidase n=1 Tax=Arcticibacter pallidicorallinus TaxID=1259464 RepID=A0A2T0UBW0_9SPHI|nr:alpha-amylase family protein [Arcticibacter pallidicorallinus]PRY55425.1 glycosidase [Arcticibacter pallidicorallinus]
MKVHFLIALIASIVWISCGNRAKKSASTTTDSINTAHKSSDKINIYQMMVRLFGNKTTTNKLYGSKDENGVGKFNDISDRALEELKKMSITHVWYTGIIEHATMTDYSAQGILVDDPDIVKGRAGSPYAIRDYYDVAPDLAVDVKNRMAEFESLVERTHKHGLKVIIDFVPNHVARTYNSDAKPAGVKDFGETDDVTKAFSPVNDFYYIPGKAFVVPSGTDAGGKNFKSPLKDLRFNENPAKATGNNVFSAKPSLGDWSETIKLNYGVDYQNKEKTYFDPIPPVWVKMKDILVFWAGKKVDGFRCDMAEMVPVEFWNWVIPQIKEVNPEIIFIAEIYNPKQYEKYIRQGKFDYLYDKVGLYDGIKRLIRNEPKADVQDISHVVNVESKGFSSKMLRFLENHDEERIASSGFAGDPAFAKPGMVISATLSGGPVMIYFGQEVAEPGKGIEGFGGDDNRTTIFDYWGVPEHQKWMNNGAFDGVKLSQEQHELRKFYSDLLRISKDTEAIANGEIMELTKQPQFNNRMYAFVRYTGKERVLVVANFDRSKTLKTHINLPEKLLKGVKKGQIEIQDLLKRESFSVDPASGGIPVDLGPSDALVYKF